MPTARISLARFTREISPGVHFKDVIGTDDSSIAWNHLASFRSRYACDSRCSVSGAILRAIATNQAVEFRGFGDGREGEYGGSEVFEVVCEGSKNLDEVPGHFPDG